MSNIDLRKRANRERKMNQTGVKVKTEALSVKVAKKDIKMVLGKSLARGQCVDVYKPKTLNRLYGRKNLCLKVFKLSTDLWGHPRGVGVSPIIESTMVQNLMAIKGLAPRVYDVIKVNGKTAQVTEFIKGPVGVVEIKDDRFHIDQNETGTDYNFIGGKLVDWQGSIFKDFKKYKRDLINRAVKGTVCKGAGNGAYQSTNYFPGLRDTKERLKKYPFVEFKGKTILDIGCNYGMISREAERLGAKRVVGLDWPQVIDITRELAILDGHFNLDFHGVDLKKLDKASLAELTGISKFDIHLFLALENWIGKPDWVKNCKLLYYEGHGAVRPFRVYEY